jgi:hypothetical protein
MPSPLHDVVRLPMSAALQAHREQSAVPLRQLLGRYGVDLTDPATTGGVLAVLLLLHELLGMQDEAEARADAADVVAGIALAASELHRAAIDKLDGEARPGF